MNHGVDQLDETQPERLLELVATASHDLRAPVRNIRQAAIWLGEHVGPDDEVAGDYLSMVQESSDRIDRLVAALADWARVGCVRLHPRSWLLGALVEKAVERVRGADPRTCEVVVDPSDLEVQCDGPLLVNLLEALFLNAMAYREPSRGLEVVVGATARFDGCEVVVSDNGAGIDERYHQTVFEPFRRLHTQQEHPGSGLGLAIVERIVARHHGQIGLASSPGLGTAISFTLGQNQGALT